MPEYLLLVRASERGSFKILASGSEGADQQKKAVEALGGDVRWQRTVAGRYDLVLLVSFPTDEACLAWGLAANARGLYTETLRAYTASEVDAARELVIDLREDLAEATGDQPETQPSTRVETE